jgi:hypothetical protein
MSCVHSPAVVEKTVLPPEVSFPLPPDPFGVEYSDDGDSVIIPSAYWILLAEYMIDTEAAIEKYLAAREEYAAE